MVREILGSPPEASIGTAAEMLNVRNIIRSGGRYFHHKELFLHSPSFSDLEDSTYYNNEAEESKIKGYNSFSLDVTEIPTGLCRDHVDFEDQRLNSLTTFAYLLVSGDYLIHYDPKSGEHFVYSLLTGALTTGIRKRLKSGVQITGGYALGFSNDFFLFTCEDGSSYTILLQLKSKNKIKISTNYKLDTLGKDKSKKKVKTVFSHPFLPFIFVVFNTGVVQVSIAARIGLSVMFAVYHTSS